VQLVGYAAHCTLHAEAYVCFSALLVVCMTADPWNNMLSTYCPCCRRYVHLYQLKLDSLQASAATAAAAATTSSSSTTAAAAAAAAAGVADPTALSTAAPAGEANSSSSALESESSAITSASSDGDLPSPTANSSSTPAGSSSSSAAAAAAALSELSHLEAELDVDDILLCRSLAELALDRRIASSTGVD
jgi:hypothetical protein